MLLKKGDILFESIKNYYDTDKLFFESPKTIDDTTFVGGFIDCEAKIELYDDLSIKLYMINSSGANVIKHKIKYDFLTDSYYFTDFNFNGRYRVYIKGKTVRDFIKSIKKLEDF